MSTWVDLGDLYVKKAGDEVSGSILMANNNLSVAYDSDTTYNVGTEIKTLRDSVSSLFSGPGETTVTSGASWLYTSCYGCSAGVRIGANANPANTVSKNGLLATVVTERPFKNTGFVLMRGAIPNQQSGIYVFFIDSNTFELRAEQATLFSIGNTYSLLVGLDWGK